MPAVLSLNNSTIGSGLPTAGSRTTVPKYWAESAIALTGARDVRPVVSAETTYQRTIWPADDAAAGMAAPYTPSPAAPSPWAPSSSMATDTSDPYMTRYLSVTDAT